MSNDLIYLSLSEMREGLSKRSFSSRELVEAHLKRVEEVSPLNAYITTTPDKAIHQANQSDARLSSGEAGLLEGIPLAIKDLFCTKDIQTTAASHILSNFIPPYESTVTQNLFDQGMVCIGKTNLDEFAMGSANLTSAFGPTLSPWKNAEGEFTVPGGSSGGSAAAVASFSAPAALGTDTGGSIRQPASFSGLVGLKPTYGRCSRYGTVAFASSLDQAGPLTRTVEDAALILQGMAGFDPKDSTSSDVPVPDYLRALQGQIKGLRVGLPKEYRLPGLRSDIETLWEKSAQWLRDQGAEVKEISLPHTQYGLPVYYILAPAEASSNLSRYDGVRYGERVEGQTLDELYEKSRGAGFGSEVKRRILIGTFVLSAGHYDAYFIRAQKVRTRIIEDFHQAFQEVDVILCPSTPTPAFTVGQEPTDEITMYMNDVFTVISNLAGLPAISVPVGMSSEGLPLGMQLIGKAFDESTLFCVAQRLMEATDINPIELLKGANA